MIATTDEPEVLHRHYEPPAPDILVAVFGSIVIALDGAGLHVALIDPRTVRGGR